MADLGKYNLEFFPEEMIALREEVRFHPDLMATLALQPDKDFYIQLCEIAAHCEILVDGHYTPEDILKLCTLLTQKLQEKRTIHVGSPLRIH